MFNLIKKYRQLLLAIFLLVIGLALRAISYQELSFSFDQVQIARAAEQIAHGDIALVGPRTGPANMFTGPLIYYIAGFFALFIPSWWAVYWTMLLITLVTGIVVYFLAKKYLDQKLANIILTLWAFSPFLIRIDRIPWNPNLAILASSLVFFPLLKKDKSLNLFDLLLIGSGVFLGYQAHFSGLLLVGLASLSILLFFKNKIVASLVVVLSFLSSLIPTLVFDLRNNWLNTKGLIELIFNKDSVASYQAGFRFVDKFRVMVESAGKMMFEGTNYQLILITGLLMISLFLVHLYKTNKIHLAKTAIWLIIIPLAFSLYRQSTPEYYFLICVPVLLFIYATVINKLLNQKQQLVLLVFLAIYGSLYSYHILKSPASFHLTAQLKAISILKKAADNQLISQLVLDIEPTEALGLQYLLEKNQLSFSKQGQVYHVVYPSYENQFVTQKISGNAHIWVDSRKADLNYVTTDNFMIAVPSDWYLYQDYQKVEGIDYQFHYLYFDSQNNYMGDLFIFNKKLSDNLLKQAKSQTEQDSKSNFTHQNKVTSWIKGRALPIEIEQIYYLNKDLLFVSTLVQPDEITVMLPE